MLLDLAIGEERAILDVDFPKLECPQAGIAEVLDELPGIDRLPNSSDYSHVELVRKVHLPARVIRDVLEVLLLKDTTFQKAIDDRMTDAGEDLEVCILLNVAVEDANLLQLLCVLLSESPVDPFHRQIQWLWIGALSSPKEISLDGVLERGKDCISCCELLWGWQVYHDDGDVKESCLEEHPVFNTKRRVSDSLAPGVEVCA